MVENQEERADNLHVDFITVQQPRRLWAISVIGAPLKIIALRRPHMIFIYGCALAAGVAVLVTWGYGLTDQYPPFRLSN